MSDRRRLFFAIWPDDGVRDRIARAARAAIKGQEAARKPIDPARYHLTLLFLGDVSPEDETRARGAAGSVQTGAFTLDLDRSGYFYRARVLWIGAAQRPEELTALWLALRGAIEAAGVPHEHRALAPHVTCLRGARRPARLPAIEPIRWNVRDFVLVHSVLGQRPEYRIIGRWPLGLTP